MYNIRNAIMQDASSISAIHHQCWKECYPYLPQGLHDLRGKDFRMRQWATTLGSSGKHATFVLEAARGILGFSHVKENTDPGIPEAHAELHACYFDLSIRRSSAGPSMMRHMLQWVVENEMKNCSVWAWEKNPVRRTYGALGLEIVCKRNRVIEGFSAPEVGYLCRDIPALTKKLDSMITQLDARGGRERSRQFEPSRLSPTEIRGGKALKPSPKSLLPTHS